MELIIVLLLILLNGLFAMTEIAILSAKKSSLQQKAKEGNKNAQTILKISSSPSRFLSTVQIGITLIGILTGVFGGAAIAESLSKDLSKFPYLDPYSETLAYIIVVPAITYLSLIIGELVPKRLALSNPEKIAGFVARPMDKISILAGPAVTILSLSTDWIIKILGIKTSTSPTVSDEEIKMLLSEGEKSGAFEKVEKDILERTMRLSDKKVKSLMTPRKEIIWLDVDSSFKKIRDKISKKPHAYFPVCRDNLDKVIGVIRTESLLIDFLTEEKIDLKKTLLKPLFIPESMDGLKVLDLFRKSGTHMALVSDEYGNTQGVLSLTDILEEIVGDIPGIDDYSEKEIIKRENGTFLVDGLVSIEEFKDYFQIKRIPGEKSGSYHTVGGFVISKIGKIPSAGDNFIHGNLKFEVIDMDGTRVDKILISKSKKHLI